MLTEEQRTEIQREVAARFRELLEANLSQIGRPGGPDSHFWLMYSAIVGERLDPTAITDTESGVPLGPWVKVVARAVEVLGTSEKALRWLNTPIRSLGDQPPPVTPRQSGRNRTRRGCSRAHRARRLVSDRLSIGESPLRALCALEILASAGELAVDYVATPIKISSDIAVTMIAVGELPENWNASEAIDATRDIGTNWANGLATAVLSVPSAVIPRERNYILNPAHPDFARIQFSDPEPFYFDDRLTRAK